MDGYGWMDGLKMGGGGVVIVRVQVRKCMFDV